MEEFRINHIQCIAKSETLSNLFTYTGYDINNKSWHQFVICPWRDDTELLYNHLFRDKLTMVGYNNDAFDYPIIHHLINHINEYKESTGEEIAKRLYKKAQEIINQEFSTIADKNKFIKQIDLYKINGYDNAARHCSLKDLEIAIDKVFKKATDGPRSIKSRTLLEAYLQNVLSDRPIIQKELAAKHGVTRSAVNNVAIKYLPRLKNELIKLGY